MMFMVMGQNCSNHIVYVPERNFKMFGYEGIMNGHNLHNLNKIFVHFNRMNSSSSHNFNFIPQGYTLHSNCTKSNHDLQTIINASYKQNTPKSMDVCTVHFQGHILHYLCFCLVNLFINHESVSILQNLYPKSIDNSHKTSPKPPFKHSQKLNLETFPPEISLNVLSHLNATDLCLAGCVWNELGNDDLLWLNLCKENWKYCNKYTITNLVDAPASPIVNYYKHLYMQLDEGTLTFNASFAKGIEYFINHKLLNNSPNSIASFLYGTSKLERCNLGMYFNERRDVFEIYMGFHNFKNVFLPIALRYILAKIKPTNTDNFLQTLLESFSKVYATCNPTLNLHSDHVFLLCFSLIMLSVDLCSPHVKNKMSKREFIKNIRHAVRGLENDELVGSFYDDIYTMGHIAPAGQIF